MVTTYAGGFSGISFSGLAGTNINLLMPQGVALDTLGNVYVAPTDFYTIPKISPAGDCLLMAFSFQN